MSNNSYILSAKYYYVNPRTVKPRNLDVYVGIEMIEIHTYTTFSNTT